MAWGYWSATTVSDRGRSPRRNQNNFSNHTQSMPITVGDRSSITQTYATVNSNNNANTTTPQTTIEIEETALSHYQLSRRPSLDLGPQGALAGILCATHGNRSGGTLSAGNTLTRVGSRHTAVEYAVPHHFHHRHACVEFHQTQLSFSDDDSSSEPGYATGRLC
ncbi:hypothetical protein JTB14_001018 [Gonioctena quinquepunctata]|nr:hypothetical protein JTB14_001018 [Gonioctena quinquepunctata]